jgi:hypothetical protein
MNLPTILYRGDSDSSGIRLLKDNVNKNQLFTNLINGGQGREIIEKPIIELINKHVNVGWHYTHFLSFSEEIEVAYKYGLGKNNVNNYFCEEYFKDDRNWTFALIEMFVKEIEITELSKGVFHCKYDSSLLVSDKKCNILLLDVCRYLEQFNGFDLSKHNSKRDKEWLVFPAQTVKLKTGNEFSARLDTGNIFRIKRIAEITSGNNL